MFITTLSPTSIKGGTEVLIPLSKVAGLYEEAAVCPLTTASASITFKFTCSGNIIATGMESAIHPKTGSYTTSLIFAS